MSDDDRAERLRRRRKRKQEGDPSEPSETSRTGEPSETSEPDEPNKPSRTDEMDIMADTSKTDETDEPSETSETGTLAEERVGTYLYLPEEQADQFRTEFKRLDAAHDAAFGRELEKHRHFAPVVMRHGLDVVAEWDAEALHDRLRAMDLL